MSEDSQPTPDPVIKPAPKEGQRVRRISTPRPKKTAKPAMESIPADEAEAVAVRPPQVDEVVSESVSSVPGSDWPEPEAATEGQPGLTESAKRKRRRRKGKGKSEAGQNQAQRPAESPVQPEAGGNEEAGGAEGPAVQPPIVAAAHAPKPNFQAPPQGQRPRVDPEILTKMAWKIYLAEVSEEGVALISDHDARDLSRRCFRLAEIFAEEQNRRR